MSLPEDYRAAVAAAAASTAHVRELLPLVLIQACVDILLVDGAGLSLLQDLRIPLAASNELVARAERLQTTLGEGPCLSAAGESAPLVADQARMAARWPLFTSELIRQTPFRSVASLPLHVSDQGSIGAVDLYSVDGSGEPLVALLAEGHDLAREVTGFFVREAVEYAAGDFDRWASGRTAAASRLNVWVAVGMVIGGAGVANLDALALLRGYAFSHDLELDELAQQLTNRDLTVETLLS